MRVIKLIEVLCIIAALCSISRGALAAGIETELYKLIPSDVTPTRQTFVRLHLTRTDSCFSIRTNSLLVDHTLSVVRVSFDIGPADFTGCPFPVEVDIPIGTLLNPGPYKIHVYREDSTRDAYFDPSFLQGVIEVEVVASKYVVTPETPAEGSVQSGVGLVRGWACDASRVEVQFDELPRIAVAHGTSRADTNATCGDDDNGYGMVFNWGLLERGSHTMRTFVDGRFIADVTFAVTGLDEPFIKGLAGDYELADFPGPGGSVTVEWSEPDQNFIITGSND